MDQSIKNPNHAYVTVSDYRTMKDVQGQELAAPGKSVEYMEANSAIAAGLAVAVAAPSSATVPLRCIKATASTGARNIGIAKKASSAAGDLIEVVTGGLAFATLGGTVAANGALAPDANGKLVAATTTSSFTIADTDIDDTPSGTNLTTAIATGVDAVTTAQLSIIAIALKAGDADDVVPVLVRRRY